MEISTTPRLKISGFGKVNNEATPSRTSAPAVKDTLSFKPLFNPSPTLSNPPSTVQTTTPKVYNPAGDRGVSDLLTKGVKTIFGTVGAIAQAVGTKAGRKEIGEGFIAGTPGAVSAGERSLSGIVSSIDKGIRTIAEKGNLPGQAAEFLSGGRIKAPKITAPTVFSKVASKLDQDADFNNQIYQTLATQGLQVDDKRSFTEKIQDPKFIARGIGQNAPNLLISLGIAAPAAVVGAPAAVVGGTAFAASAILEGGFAYNEAKNTLEQDARPEMRQLAQDKDFLSSVAVPVAIVNGLLDAIPVTKFLTRSPIGGEVKKQILREATTRIVRQALEEAGTESLQEITTNAVAKIYDENRSLLQNVPESGFFGGLLGGVLSTGGDLPVITRDLKVPVGLSIEDVSGGTGESKSPEEIVKYVDELDRSVDSDFVKPEDKGILDFTKKQIEGNKSYVRKTVDIEELLKKDPDLREYVEGGEQRYEGERDFFDLDAPVVVGADGEVYDGMNRILTKYQKGEKTIEAFVGTALLKFQPSTAEEAATQYFDKVITPKTSQPGPLVVSGDNIKEYFGRDYDTERSNLYAEASYKLIRRLINESPKKDLVFLGGGPGAGKTEFILNPLVSAGFDGIVYDTTLSNFEGTKALIDQAKAQGKNITVSGILADLDQARTHTVIRENETGRQVSDDAFARGHVGFVETLRKLIEDGTLSTDQIKLFDFRDIRSYDKALESAVQGRFTTSPLALLKGIAYNKEQVKSQYARQQYIEKVQPGRALQKPGVGARADTVSRENRTDTGDRQDGRRDQAGLPREESRIRKEQPGNELGIKPVVSRNEKELVQYKLESADKSLPSTPEEFDALPLEKQEEILPSLPTHLQQQILGYESTEGGEIKDSYNGAVRDIVYGRLKIRANKDSRRDYRFSFRAGDYMRIFRSDKPGAPFMGDPLDVVAMQGDGDVNNLVDEIVAGLEYKHQIDEKSIAERRRLREEKQKEARAIKLEAEKEKFVRDIERGIYQELTKKRYSYLQAIKFKERIERKYSGIQGMLDRLNTRRTKIRAIQAFFNLTDKEMKKIRGNRDPRWMDETEFNSFLANIRSAAETVAERGKIEAIVRAEIERQSFRKVENLIKAMELPPIKDMTADQLRQFSDALDGYQFADTFLGPRMIETVKNTDIGPAKTVREIRESLAKQAGVDFASLSDVRGDWGDRFNYDASLAEKNPLYKFMVTEWLAHQIQADQKALEYKKQIDELAFKARASRKRTLVERLVPQDETVVEWLQGSVGGFALRGREDMAQIIKERAQIAKRMTPEELDYAKALDRIFMHYYTLSAAEGQARKTLLGIKFSRFRGAYFPHRPQSFFERWKEDGLINAIAGIWSFFTDLKVDFDAIGPTGEVLGYEKFLKYALKREGVGDFSKNAAKVTMAYVSAFERKLALDAIIPKLDAYTFSLQRESTVKDPTGHNVDGQLRQFVREWLNNKKGRKVKLFFSQGSKLDAMLRAFKLFLAIKDLGFNIIAGTASVAGGEISNYVGLKAPEFAKGIGRALTTKGKNLARTYNGVVGEPTFENIISAANDIGDTFRSGAFAIFQDIFYRVKRQFFLGALTDQEYESGVVTPKRLAEIKLRMARFHPIDDTKSVIGSTTEGQVFTMYKTWAVPFLMTAKTNAQKTLRAFAKADTLSGKAQALATDEAKQLMKLTVGSLGIYLFFQTVFGEDDLEKKNKSFIASLKRRVMLETASALSALNPSTWTSIRPWEFAKDVSEVIDLMLRLEQYKTDDPAGTYEEGDLKFVNAAERLFLPAAVRQFLAPAQQKAAEEKKASSSVRGTGTIKIPSVKVPSIKVPSVDLKVRI